jgi:pyridinium-3,5-biscarboxylic acid mononucleotide synthase
MNPSHLRTILDQLDRHEISADDAQADLTTRFRDLPFEDLGFARVDHHRALRTGFPEVIFGMGKTPAQVSAIAERIANRGQTLLVTRTTEAAFEAVREKVPDAVWYADAHLISRRQDDVPAGHGTLLVVAAGTSDLSVAEEAARSAEVMNNQVDRLYDVGVAGLHRLLCEQPRLTGARAIIVVAGMEGALPSVVGGLVNVPVIAVPTSVGYGASFGGVAALLGMLNSCAPGVAVVNIDNGFGAACIASLINHL